jgi:hypothetical protein
MVDIPVQLTFSMQFEAPRSNSVPAAHGQVQEPNVVWKVEVEPNRRVAIELCCP